jgi:hypothetical protein
MAWKTLSLHFQQTYEGGYRYLDKCGEFMLAATERMNFIMSDATPAGAKMEIPEQGVHATCDARSLAVAQELPVDDGKYFLDLCKGLAELVMSHFGPKSIFKNGLLWKSYTPYPNTSDMLAASLKYGGTFHEELAKAVGMVPGNKNLDYSFVSGSKDLHVVLQPVTFERLNLPRRNVDARATRDQKSRVDRLNQFAERIGDALSYALVLDVDLMENDPPKASSLAKHFEELRQKSDSIRKLFETR